MKTFGNIIWHIPFLGFLFALGYAIAGAFWCITVIGLPLGLGLLQFSRFLLTPFSMTMVSASDVQAMKGAEQNALWKSFSLAVRILYFPFGLLFALIIIFVVCFEFVSIIGIPCGLVWAKSLKTVFNPVGKVCVPAIIGEEIRNRKNQATLDKYAGKPAATAYANPAPVQNETAGKNRPQPTETPEMPNPFETAMNPLPQEPAASPSAVPSTASSASSQKYENPDTGTADSRLRTVSGTPKTFPKWIIMAAAGIILLGGLGWAGYTFLFNPDKNTEAAIAENREVDRKSANRQSGEPVPASEPEKTGSPESKAAAETQPAAKEADMPEQPAEEAQPEPDRTPQTATGAKVYPFGIYNGGLADGLPQGEGTMRYSQRQKISKNDRQNRYAEPGDYIQGQWHNGELYMGKWFDKNGNPRGDLRIGRAD